MGMMQKTAALGLILAGGRGSRMGGVNKALINLSGEPLLLRTLRVLAPQVVEVALSANDPRLAELTPDLAILPDRLPSRPPEASMRDTATPRVEAGEFGPLGGILAGMIHAQSRGLAAVVSVAVDTPFFPVDLAQRLQAGANGGLAFAATTTGVHPTFGIWPVLLRGDLAEFLAAGGRKMRDFTTAHGAQHVHFADEGFDPFFNINTPDDLLAAEILNNQAG